MTMAAGSRHAMAPAGWRRAARWLLPLLLAALCAVALAASQKWLTIAKDDLHDPDGPAVGVLVFLMPTLA